MPSRLLCASTMQVRHHVIGLTCAILTEGEYDETCLHSLVDKVAENDRAVQGNRPPDSPVDWSALRRFWLGTLRVLADELDK